MAQWFPWQQAYNPANVVCYRQKVRANVCIQKSRKRIGRTNVLCPHEIGCGWAHAFLASSAQFHGLSVYRKCMVIFLTPYLLKCMWHGSVFIYRIKSKCKLKPKNEILMLNEKFCNKLNRRTISII